MNVFIIILIVLVVLLFIYEVYSIIRLIIKRRKDAKKQRAKEHHTTCQVNSVNKDKEHATTGKKGV